MLQQRCLAATRAWKSSDFSPDSEAMGFLLQITMSCPCALSRQVAGAGAGCRCWCWCWCCELAVHVVETGCWCRCRRWVPGAGAGAVSWLCTWWRQVGGAGTRYVHCSMRNVRLSTDHCFSMFQPATHKIVVLDTAWPWASEAYGLCPLCALFCAHKLIRARSYCLIVLQIVASSVLQ